MHDGDSMAAADRPILCSDAALRGEDATPGIVSVQPLLDDSEQAHVRLYQRETGTSAISSREEWLYPFFLISDVRLLRGFERSRFQYQELAGDNYYRFLVVLPSWPTYWDAIRHVERSVDNNRGRPEELYLINNPVQQYLMQSGRTLFKEMTFDDLHRLQLDIEVYTEDEFPNASRPDDTVIIVSMTDNRGWQRVIDAREQSEASLLQETIRIIQEHDPDVIEGHNIYNFDFPYLMDRCRRYGVPFAIGRDGSEPRTFESSMRFAERTVDYTALEIAGRHVVDTYFQVMSFDVFKRDLPGYGLKEAARYFGFADEDRTYVDGGSISRLWREDPERLISYALDDAVETERLARHLSGSTFYLTQLLPMNYGRVARTGPAAKIESLFVREYLRQRHSIPKSEWGSQMMGGYTDIFLTGVLGPVVYADVESLYPSIMLNYGVKPAGDELEVFPRLLQRLTDLRFEAKNQMADAPDEETRSELDARQSSYKVLINSFYGNLGFSMAAFNDFSEADRVASTGQKLLRQIIDLLEDRGARVIEVDTDGVLFIPPDGVRGDEAERAFVASLNKEMPEGIRIGFDGRYRTMLSYKKKNYALLSYDGNLKFKGSSLISRSNERFGRRFVRKAIRLLLDEDIQELHDLYLTTRDRIIAHDWESVRSFSRTETLKDTVERYESDVSQGKRPRAAAYELAIAREQETGQPVRKGDRITYYITGENASVTAFENCKLASAWDPDHPDENTAYYLRRLDQFAQKFSPFFEDHDFRRIFSPEDLFGFSPDGIEILEHEHEREEPETEVPF